MSKSTEILQALDAATGPLRVDEVCEAVGEADEGASKRIGALLTYLRTQGRVERLGSTQLATWRITDAGRQWLADVAAESDANRAPPPPKAACAQAKAAPTPKAAARPPRALVPAPAAKAPALHVDPPGSVALADDGSIVLIEGDRVAARITAQQAANVAALVGRYRQRP